MVNFRVWFGLVWSGLAWVDSSIHPSSSSSFMCIEEEEKKKSEVYYSALQCITGELQYVVHSLGEERRNYNLDDRTLLPPSLPPSLFTLSAHTFPLTLGIIRRFSAKGEGRGGRGKGEGQGGAR